jgi:phosphoglycolate phosphatase-like HAD superfamily hydrolase
MRNNRKNLLQQLNTLKINDLFDKIIVCKSKTENSKYNALKKIKFNTAIFIGDTEEDTKTARKLGIKCIGITNGLRMKELLDADYYCDEICNIIFP